MKFHFSKFYFFIVYRPTPLPTPLSPVSPVSEASVDLNNDTEVPNAMEFGKDIKSLYFV